jgi:hypothetical protein
MWVISGAHRWVGHILRRNFFPLPSDASDHDKRDRQHCLPGNNLSAGVARVVGLKSNLRMKGKSSNYLQVNSVRVACVVHHIGFSHDESNQFMNCECRATTCTILSCLNSSEHFSVGSKGSFDDVNPELGCLRREAGHQDCNILSPHANHTPPPLTAWRRTDCP